MSERLERESDRTVRSNSCFFVVVVWVPPYWKKWSRSAEPVFRLCSRHWYELCLGYRSGHFVCMWIASDIDWKVCLRIDSIECHYVWTKEKPLSISHKALRLLCDYILGFNTRLATTSVFLFLTFRIKI